MLITPVAIFIDIKTGLLAGLEPRPLNHYSKVLAKAGMMLFSAVIGFYFIKTYLLIMKKKSFTHWGLLFLQHLVKILRKLHPFAGAIALVILAIHGYIFAYRVYDFEFNIGLVTGYFAFAMFFFTGIAGIMLYRKQTDLSVRKVHRYAALIVLILVIAHVLFPD
jgi:hypothetical protein